MAKAFLLLGGNLGERDIFLSKAKQLINTELGNIVETSSIYETQPWGFKHANNFYNQIIVVNTHLEPLELLTEINKIENNLGRKRDKQQYIARTIDIDIIFYESRIFENEKLIIPHKELQNRMFALKPLAEIAPNFSHPKLNKTIKQLITECSDKLEVKQLSTQVTSNS